jgi:PAS domain S-box-containing protein
MRWVCDGKEDWVMNSGASPPQAAGWLAENGPRQLEQLCRLIVSLPANPILIADNAATCRDANSAARKLFGLSRDEIVGCPIADLMDPDLAQTSKRWRVFLEQGAQAGTLRLVRSDGHTRTIEYSARANVLPARHILVLRDVAEDPETKAECEERIPPWVKDYAFYLLDGDGQVAAWFSGAERIMGYTPDEALGRHLSFLDPGGPPVRNRYEQELKRAATAGHFGSEGWYVKRDQSHFWASVIIMALKDVNGELQGFGGVVRDFSDRRDRDEELRHWRSRSRLNSSRPAIAGVASCEFDRTPEVNEALLELVGYTREDLAKGRVRWSELTPHGHAALDELAYEEGVQFGACTPYEKELIRKDGNRVPVLAVTAVLNLCPFRWITFVQAIQTPERIEGVDEDVELTESFEEMVGGSSALRRVQRHIEVVAPTDANVLILGETGTGKELVARAIHRLSPRRPHPFVTLNCAAIPTGLLESELFGYEKGAFTGALSQKIGRFELAHRGTLFLDEVGDIPLELQPKLLRALQEKSFERLGGTRTIPIDVRLVAATNRNLPQMMGDKLFRSDLYYRLKVFPITMPPLRDHPEDIPVLVRHFTRKYAGEMGRQIDQIPVDTMRALVSWHWPGNVRELENFIERSVILSRGPNLRAPLSEIRSDQASGSGNATLEQVERDYIIRVLQDVGGVVSKAATRLGMPRTTLNAMMRKLNISRTDL